jgi:long-chain acyl-CoA synthetase
MASTPGSNGTNGMNGTHGSSGPVSSRPFGEIDEFPSAVGRAPTSQVPLEPARLFDGARFLLLGGTGFLGKIFWVMLLDRYPNVGKLFLLCRSSEKKTSEERFWSDIATSEALDPLRKRYGDGFEAFLREKLVPVDGDMARPSCGLDAALLRELRGTIDAVVNVAGVVDFNPPLDEALETNAFGAQNLIELCRALGDAPLYHTSTCYTVGNREGTILEDVPGREFPFPRADELGRDLWDPEREIRDCLDLVAQAKGRAEDAFRQSAFLEQAKKNLERRGEPTVGAPLEAELKSVKRRFVSDRLVEAGLERAEHWGWPNIYTYTKSIGEQVIARSGLRYVIARPASCESTIRFPFPAWNEGIGTSAPIIFMTMKGGWALIGRHTVLDFIPADMVTAGMILALAELLEGTNKPVYQFGAADVNPCTAQRFGELIGLYKRKYYLRTGKGNPLLNFIQAHYEPAFMDENGYDVLGPPGVARAARLLSKMLKNGPGPMRGVAKQLEGVAGMQEKVGDIMKLFAPFTFFAKGPFSCENTRAAYARLSQEDREKLDWSPEKIDWADYWMKQHMPAMEKRVIPWMEEKFKRELKPLKKHETLVTLLDQMAERHEHAPALSRVEADGLTRITYLELRERAGAVAARLAQAGVQKGDRVVLSAKNHPDWPIAYFGILRAGATAVPVDPQMEAMPFGNVARESGARAAILDESQSDETLAAARGAFKFVFNVHEVGEPDPGLTPPEVTLEEDDVASLIYTSGTTGTPKGVMLSHGNFTSLLASLAPIFPLGTKDRVLSVLPLHHTFEFTCGMLLPLSRGARIVYVDELSGDRVAAALKSARVSAMVGVPALWQVLERRILAQVKERGPIVEAAFNLGMELNRLLGQKLGLDLGKVLFGVVHEELGGNIRYLISGGAALPKDTAKLFQGLGLHLTEGYGLTEAAPVLTVSKPSPGSPAGQVGKAIPGVRIKIADPDESGVGEVLAKGPNVMLGYTDAEATNAVIDADGWLHTGDLGKLDRKGRLVIVGRSKELILTASGENIYPDDVERQLGKVAHIKELCVVGIEGSRGAEKIACLAVPEEDESIDRAARNERAMKSLRDAIGKLPYGKQPSVVQLYDAPLPRTATRKVKRSEVREILLRTQRASVRPPEADTSTSAVRVAIHAIRGIPLKDIHADSTLQGDLGFDSLLLTELLVALENKHGTIEPDKLQQCRTVAEVEALVGRERPATRTKTIEGRKRDEERAVEIPSFLQEQGKKLIGRLQDAFYGKVMVSTITGQAFIPHNRNTIVVANHSSHLDMGFVRHALGKYGEDIVSLAAQDYFFEGNEVRKTFFENFTNLKPLDRRSGLKHAERVAAEVIQSGKTVLLFPEGTRSPDGQVHEFKPLLGHLALTYEVDILPVYLSGTRDAMPKGSKVPTKREIAARIGPPLTLADMRRLTKGMTPADAAREVARLAREAVLALQAGKVLDLATLKSAGEATEQKREHPLVELFQELEAKFKPGSVEKPISFYFTFGDAPFTKWTLKIDPSSCEIKSGKPPGGTADCVLKTSPELFARIVRESYTPSPAEFISGAIKSNDIELLQTFQKAFQLA